MTLRFRQLLPARVRLCRRAKLILLRAPPTPALLPRFKSTFANMLSHSVLTTLKTVENPHSRMPKVQCNGHGRMPHMKFTSEPPIACGFVPSYCNVVCVGGRGMLLSYLENFASNMSQLDQRNWKSDPSTLSLQLHSCAGAIETELLV